MVLRTVRADRDTDPDVADIAALEPSDGDMLYWATGGTRYNTTPSTSYMRGLLNTASEAALKAAINLEIGTDVQAYDADLASWAGVTRASGFDTFAATPSSANLRSLLSDETGTGSAVFANSPTLVTPAIDYLRVNRQASDPAAYETRLLVVETGNIDNLGTLRHEYANPTDGAGHCAFRYQDYASNERGAFGLGGDWAGNPYRYCMFVGIGNITGNDQGSTAKDTSFVVSLEQVDRTGIPDQIQPFLVASGHGWIGLRGVDVSTGTRTNGLFIKSDGRVAIGAHTSQPDYGTAYDSGISLPYTLNVNGQSGFDGDITQFGSTLSFYYTNTGASANEGKWRSITSSAEWFFEALSDAGVASSVWSAQRSGGTATAFKTFVPVISANGSAGAPSFSFSSDPDTGMYRVGADVLGFSTGNSLSLEVSSSVITAYRPLLFSHTAPVFGITESDAAANNQKWRLQVNAAQLDWSVLSDDELTSAAFLTVTRTDAAVTTVNLQGTNVYANGNYIYRAGGTDIPVTDGGTGASNASDARTNLGLGSAATQNTGTSGANVPLMNGANTWSAVQTFTSSPTLSAAVPRLYMVETDAAADAQKWKLDVNSGVFKVSILNDAESGGVDVVQITRSSYTSATMAITAGVTIGSPTGGNKGAGTLNAVAVYDDDVLLTDLVCEFAATKSFDADRYAGHPVASEMQPWWFDLDSYGRFWREAHHLPGMKSWRDPADKPSTGESITRLTAVVETQAALIDTLHKRLLAVEGKGAK